MFKSKLSRVIVSLLRRIAGVTRSGAKRLMRAMLQTLMAMGRRARLPVAGFVLPTVTMVLLVVILLTVAITLRSFDRANTARNVRVNQQVLAAATPALDRAKAKIEYMLREDPQRPTATPSDTELYRMMSAYDATNDFYKFADEQRLILRFPVNNGTTLVNAGDPQGPLVNQANQENEAINTAWRYPVDTNNDGKFDTFTLYGIYFRTPRTQRARTAIEARTPPMETGTLNPACTQGEGTIARLVGTSGWQRASNGRFQKSFFVYTVNVPITPNDIQTSALDATKYEAFKGTSSVSALEYQQDQSRIPLSNNAVVYEDDLDISPGVSLNLNGRILTNSNLLVSPLGNAQLRLFQVSSKQSCFYEADNSKIVVGGNVVNGWAANSTTQNPVLVDLFKSITSDPNQPGSDNATINNATNQSVRQNSLQVLYNNNAYSNRLNALVQAQLLADTTGANDPVSVQQAVLNGQTRDQALQDYFKARLRKVPFAEVPPGTPNGGVNPANAPFIIQDAGVDSLRPIPLWSLPTTETAPNVSALTGPTNLNIRPAQLPSRNPGDIQPGASELNLGERVVVGNNLPQQRWNGTKFISDSQQVDGTTQWTGGGIRTRTPQVIKLANVGDTDRGNGTGEAPPATNPPYRDGFWERTAAEIPATPLDAVGGLRVITSAGVYDRTNSFLPPPSWIDAGTARLKSGPANIATLPVPANTYDDPATAAVELYPVVWPDSMPMSPLGQGSDVYDNLTGNWRRWVNAPPAVAPAVPPVVVAQPNLSDLPATQTNPNFSFVAENPLSSRQFAKGDLRMRATAVYHYANNGYNPTTLAAAPAGTQPQQTPVACISSYYDPSNASTARNLLGLTDISGDVIPRSLVTRGVQQAFIGSNNGITYGPPTARLAPATSRLNANGLLENGDPILEAQANLVFPDGRFANGPLRTALQVPDGQRTLAQKAAIDSTNCALQILDGTIARGAQLMPIPDGAIQEVAFLNGREIKASDADNPATLVNEAFTLSSPASNDPVPARAQQAATLTGNYNQPLEEREPLEIRATQLDIALLRGPNPIAGPNATAPEWLLPNSGIIYASRDDALPDRSARTLNNGLVPPQIDETTSKRISPTDYQLDPTRKPNGIVLINGQQLFRGGATPTASNNLNAIVREKGLTFVSNLPVYIKNNFNLHGNIPPAPPGTTAAFTPVEEFTETLSTVAPIWGNFYTRNNQLNTNFACRAGDPRLPQCTNGDFWRPATVLADSLTLLSQNYRFGFRNEGDFDLRNNAGPAAVWPRRQQGFFNNNYVTNGLSSGAFLPSGNLAAPAAANALTDATYSAAFANGLLTSSYFNNFVTPVQRRGNFPQYVMETCTKLPVAACTDNDWFVNPLAAQPLTAADAITSAPNYGTPVNNTSVYQAGSTVDPPLPQLQRFPRRIAFQRNPTPTPPATTPPANALLNPATPAPLGIAAGGLITPGILGAPRANSLWFAGSNGPAVNFDNASLPYVVNRSTTPANTADGANVPLPPVAATSAPPNSAIGSVANPAPTALPAAYNGSQPLLLPVPQIQTQSVANPTGGNTMPRGTTNARFTGWIPQAVNTTFNLIVAAGDTPSRTLDVGFTTGDFNGGLQNLPRFLESWNNGGSITNIRGSFIQLNRSAFSTAPYQPILPGAVISSVFQLQGAGPLPPPLAITNTYNTDTGAGLLPYFSPPTRNWGYDVGLLSQPPDLFTQKFTTPSIRTQPAEYFREVPRNDTWVTTLMCGVVAPDQPNGGNNATAMRSNCPT
ncbi:hormogonium polysaccharide biosynthesis protein HpsA [Microcoleus sp. T3_A4]|uniref:hormogonium polysaccharide biosynthesis protein HpsA n=1 Tax=Microcoleus sp. T3_A4 TaxID=2818968 RepID=UPI002FD084DE